LQRSSKTPGLSLKGYLLLIGRERVEEDRRGKGRREEGNGRGCPLSQIPGSAGP